VEGRRQCRALWILAANIQDAKTQAANFQAAKI